MTRSARLTAHTDIGTSPALLSDHELADLVAEGTPLGTGIGGRSTLIEVDGRGVFVKRIPLTDVELRPGNARSTANVLGLPAYFHYGIGSPGFGAWRELAVHTMTTNWVLADRFPGFPLTHHWRILPQPPQPLPAELADVERAVAYWGGCPQVRERIEGLRTATASLALFLEYIPHTLHDWLDARLRTDEADTACASVERELTATTDFLREGRLLHFDAHFQNILTDGRRLYLADYGLALSARFRLTPQERDFFERHRHYDSVYTAFHFVNWLATALYGHDRDDRETFVRACSEGLRPQGIPPVAAGIIERYAPLAVVMGDFARRLQNENRLTPYPYEALELAQEGAGMPASR
ncbi:protein kinase family protein [Streptomyces sp. Marseille-Q5077]|uniref:protein kinase family protein n=1 Tax=Streptomyces sp. Marseille-Q5077 TaxID=3418995 RepID=UPI003D018CD8